MRTALIFTTFTMSLFACASSDERAGEASTNPAGPDAASPVVGEGGAPSSSSSPSPNDGGDASLTKPGPLSFVAVTFNTGISEGKHHDAPPNDGFTSEEAKTNADYYGNGLAWKPAMADTTAFFKTLAPDVISFQEIFHPGDCADVPANKRAGFICETWAPGDPTVAQVVLGAGYQVVCNIGKPDKCLAVKAAFGKVKGCASSLCLDGLAGAQITDCGKGTRIGRGVIELASGGTLTVVTVHGSSGMSTAENECRKKQFKQVFSDLDGAPAANGTRNLILGDFNTDPGRLTSFDVSAEYLADHVGNGEPFHFLTEVGSSVTPTYTVPLVSFLPAGVNIDHVISDALKGSCWTAGITAGHPPVTSMTYFDHKATVCTLSE